MSVHSLIDKLENEPADEQFEPSLQPKPTQPIKLALQPNLFEPTLRKSLPPTPLPVPFHEGQQLRSPQQLRAREQSIDVGDGVVPAHICATLLGPECNSPMPVALLEKAVLLKTEQTKLRAEELRAEAAARNLQIVELAVKNDVPSHLIPSMCVGPAPPRQQVPYRPEGQPQMLGLGSPYRQETPTDPYAPSSSRNLPHVRLPAMGRSFDADNASAVNLMNFRFGAGSRLQPSPQINRRPRSPARIGAAAVATLAAPITPQRPAHRTLPTHQRHFSMPAEISKDHRRPSQLQLSSGYSSMQVKPSPAQPLHKQTRNSQIPSQESMSSFQHVIQFHHWHPENPEKTVIENRRSSSTLSQSLVNLLHKRRRSNDMSVDIRESKAEADISMDAADTTITEQS